MYADLHQAADNGLRIPSAAPRIVEHMFERQGTLYALDFRIVRSCGHNAERACRSSAFSAISLYCGAGGLDLGFTRAGFNVSDGPSTAIRLQSETYNSNLEPYGFCGDVLKVDPPSEHSSRSL